MKKYELTEEIKTEFGITLHRIRALRSFGDVEEGELGGWIEKKKNLSQEYNSWVYDNAKVSGDAWVYGDARVSGNALVYGDADISSNSDIFLVTKIGSRNGTTTFFKSRENEIWVNCGCFSGNIDQFATKVTETHGDNEHGQAYRLAIQIAKLRIKVSE